MSGRATISTYLRNDDSYVTLETLSLDFLTEVSSEGRPVTDG